MTLTNNLANSRLKYDRGCKMTMSERRYGCFALTMFISGIEKAVSGAGGFSISRNGLLLCRRIVRNRRFFLLAGSGSSLLRLEFFNHLVGICWQKVDQLLAERIEHRL